MRHILNALWNAEPEELLGGILIALFLLYIWLPIFKDLWDEFRGN